MLIKIFAVIGIIATIVVIFVVIACCVAGLIVSIDFKKQRKQMEVVSHRCPYRDL
jgi:hypothetical protein